MREPHFPFLAILQASHSPIQKSLSDRGQWRGLFFRASPSLRMIRLTQATMLSVAFLSFPLAASALVLSPATSDAIVQPAVSQNLTKALGSLIGLSQSANSTSSSLHSPPVWSCDGARFGYLLNIYSCAEAVGVMFSGRDIDIQRSWFNRGTEGTGLPLPQRFMSCKFPSLRQAGL